MVIELQDRKGAQTVVQALDASKTRLRELEHVRYELP